MYPQQGPVSGPPILPSAPPPPEQPVKPLKQTYEGQVSHPPPPLVSPPTFSISNIDWSTGLCGWYTDIPNCCITSFCPCITFGELSEIIDRGASSCAINGLLYAMLVAVFGCACMFSFFYRSRMRQQYNLKGSLCGDCCIHFWCEVCALSQEYRELKLRGFHMHSGWHANVQNQTVGTMTLPPLQTGMNR